MNDIEMLLAIEEIKQLKARYFRSMDTKEFQTLHTVFAPDATFDFREALRDPVLGTPEGVNIVKKHIKRGRARQAGIVEVEAPLHVSNVMLVCPNCKQPTRVCVREGADGKNIRYCKKCDALIPRPEAA